MLLIGLIGYINWIKVRDTSKEVHFNISQRNKVSKHLDTIINQHQKIKEQLYQHSLSPESVSKIKLSKSTVNLAELSTNLDITFFDHVNYDVIDNVTIQMPLDIHMATVDLVAMRSNMDRWLPASTLMNNRIDPNRLKIITLLNEMLEDNQILSAESHLTQIKILKLKAEFNHIAAEFRLFVLNRIGLFYVQNETFNEREKNIKLLYNHFLSNINDLELTLDHEKYSFINSFVMPDLKEATVNWTNYMQLAVIALREDHWRQDIPILMKLDNLLNNYHHSITLLRTEITNQADTDIEKLYIINQSFTRFLVLLSFLFLIIAILGYVFFKKGILNPILQTTRAMLQQSTGESHELTIPAKSSETNDMVDAFNLMSEQIRIREEKLDFIAHHDPLTNLPNRLLFNERLEHAIKVTERNDRIISLLLLDLDHFKTINDTLGHLFGDELLQETAMRLQSCLRDEDTVARLGGDEFAIILENISNKNEVNIIADKIIKLFNSPFLINDQKLTISTSIGIAISPTHSQDTQTLIRFADLAMYKSKESGRNQYSWFSENLDLQEKTILNFENQLREAIKKDQFEIYLQPIIDINNSDYIAAEALIRWNHPKKGFLSPGQFLPQLSNTEILFDMTCWTLKEIIKTQNNIKKSINIDVIISINLSPNLFQVKSRREEFTNILIQNVKNPELLVLEITEDTLITDIKNTSLCLNLLNDHGFKVALDDFGTGQSSLSHLQAFPIDSIKIDKSFIQNVLTNKKDADLTSAVISLAIDLGMKVVAEGVEEKDQLEFLSNKGCHIIQGFYFSKPASIDQFKKFISK